METPEGLRTVECREDEYVLDAAARGGVQLPFLCRQGRCLTCAGRLLAGEVDQSDADAYYPEDRERGFVLLCKAKPRSSLRILTHQQHEMRKQRRELGLPAPYA